MLKLDVVEKKNIVLLHGWGANTNKLMALKTALKSRGWDVYLPKIPGFEAKAPDAVWDLEKYSRYLYDDACTYFKNKKFFVFGHSFGGRVAIKIAGWPRVEGVILCAAGGLSRGNPVKRYCFLVLSKIGKVLLFVLPFANIWKKILYKAAREHDYEKLDGKMKLTFQKIVAENLKLNAAKLDKNALILWGELDKVTPIKDAYFLRDNVKNSNIKIFPNAGHTLPYKKPNQIAAEIEKWAQL